MFGKCVGTNGCAVSTQIWGTLAPQISKCDFETCCESHVMKHGNNPFDNVSNLWSLQLKPFGITVKKASKKEVELCFCLPSALSSQTPSILIVTNSADHKIFCKQPIHKK
jgi:hypothetical protein